MAIASKGSMGTGVSSTSSTSWTLTSATTALAAGDFAILVAVTDNTATTDGASSDHTSVTGGTGTWSKLGEWTNTVGGAAADGVTVSLWLFKATGTNNTGTVYTVNIGTARVDKVASMWAFTKASGADVVLDPEPATNPIGNVQDASNGFGSAAFSGLSGQSRLYFRGLGKEANTTTAITVSTGFTAITGNRSRNNASAVTQRGEFRINTSTGETSNPTLAVAGDTAGLFVALKELYTGSGDAAFAGFGASGSGDVVANPSGSGTPAFAGFEASGSGSETIPGSGSAAFNAYGMSGAGSEEFSGSGTPAFAGYTASGTGDHSEGAPPPSGSGDAAFAGFGASGSGSESIPGSGDAAFAGFGASGSGSESIPGSGDAAFAGFGASGSGSESIPGSGGAAFAGYVASGDGVIIEPATGSGDAAFGGFEASGTGTIAGEGVVEEVTRDGGGGGRVSYRRQTARLADWRYEFRREQERILEEQFAAEFAAANPEKEVRKSGKRRPKKRVAVQIGGAGQVSSVLGFTVRGEGYVDDTDIAITDVLYLLEMIEDDDD